MWLRPSFHLSFMSETTKSTQALIDEKLAIEAQTALLRAKIFHRQAEEHLKGSLFDRPWFPWVAIPCAMCVGAAMAALAR